jgi:hypothetical protein
MNTIHICTCVQVHSTHATHLSDKNLAQWSRKDMGYLNSAEVPTCWLSSISMITTPNKKL